MTDQVKGIRNEVIHKFCRTVLWIDDEIHLDTGLSSVGTNPLFKNKFDEFTRSKLLCHMMGFPEVRSGTDPFAPQQKVSEVLSSCVSLALQSDVVIVDWMLGSADSSEYAEKIIRELLGKDKGHRIIVVLSQHEPAESSLEGLSFESETETLWKNGEGQFLLSLRKDEFKNANLFEEICKALLTAYPDYLHLAALEIAGRIKDVTPQWLSRIPASADVGVLVERGNTFDEKSWNDGIQECIATNLLEDLSCVARIRKLDTLSAEALKPSNSDGCEGLVAFTASDPNLQQAVSALKECVKDDSPQPFKKGNYEIVSDNRGNRDVMHLVEGVEAFAEFCEKRSGHDWEGYSVCPGAVYEGLADGAQSKLRAIDKKDIVGELIDLELNKVGISTLKITPDMVLEKTGVARGHYMFAMADTLALAVVDAQTALTGVANVKYKVPVYAGANLVAKAEVTNRRNDKYFICVRIKNNNEEVFRAKFIVVSLDDERKQAE